jgi:hypothetical protein
MIEGLFGNDFNDTAENIDADIAVAPLSARLEKEASLRTASDELGEGLRLPATLEIDRSG